VPGHYSFYGSIFAFGADEQTIYFQKFPDSCTKHAGGSDEFLVSDFDFPYQKHHIKPA
jgi:hypothetical protein